MIVEYTLESYEVLKGIITLKFKAPDINYPEAAAYKNLYVKRDKLKEFKEFLELAPILSLGHLVVSKRIFNINLDGHNIATHINDRYIFRAEIMFDSVLEPVALEMHITGMLLERSKIFYVLNLISYDRSRVHILYIEQHLLIKLLKKYTIRHVEFNKYVAIIRCKLNTATNILVELEDMPIFDKYVEEVEITAAPLTSTYSELDI